MRVAAGRRTLATPPNEETTMFYDDEVVVGQRQADFQAAAARRRLVHEARAGRSLYRRSRWLRLVPPGTSTRPGRPAE